MEEDEVERRPKAAAGDVDIEAIGNFIKKNGYRRAMISEYLDGKSVYRRRWL